MKSQYDVIVFGGGTAGAIAAIQAGRSGAETLLVEKNAMLGGTMTVAGLNAPDYFFAWGKQIIGGIGWELVKKTLEETGQTVPRPETATGKYGTERVSVDITVYAALCDEEAIKAGVEILFHSMPAAVSFKNDIWTVSICSKTGLQECQAKVIIDATGDANVVALAGCELVLPEIVQPASLKVHCSGYDMDKIDLDKLSAAYEKAVAAGEIMTTDVSWYDSSGPGPYLKQHGKHANHIRAPRAETSEDRSKVEIEARRAVMRMYRFFRKQPGLENFRVDQLWTETGIRETATIKGKKTVKANDYEAGKIYDDAVCYAFYPIDIHLNDGMGVKVRQLKEKILPTIPRGALLPADSRSLIVAGRCVSSDREANSALRVKCPCMAMGQAAGAMAALSVRKAIDPEDLPMNDIYAELRKHGAIVPGDIE